MSTLPRPARAILSLVTALGLLAGCRSPGVARGIQPFRSDGCSLFPDGTFRDKNLWLSCCEEHDVAYWRGGTREEREQADLRLRDCILAKTGDAALADLVFEGVRGGGAPVFPTWYRWGYGWPYGRGYQPLTPEETRQADAMLRRDP